MNLKNIDAAIELLQRAKTPKHTKLVALIKRKRDGDNNPHLVTVEQVE